ncbi:MAG: Rrf2 family transcriptional regulator [Spirochaetaceae bacterium]|jgi:Rrf2 family protein|nr:Rrf2 family transcriptional regulator [Spirochaetaceae bacterium]
MKLSTRARYGMRALLEIAKSSEENKPLVISQISESQEVSQKYLETLLVQMRNEGILQSKRGKNGGYLLGRKAELITVLQVIEALDGPLDLVSCDNKGEFCQRKYFCSTVGLWKHLTATLSDEMNKITIKDLIHNKDLNEVLF